MPVGTGATLSRGRRGASFSVTKKVEKTTLPAALDRRRPARRPHRPRESEGQGRCGLRRQAGRAAVPPCGAERHCSSGRAAAEAAGGCRPSAAVTRRAPRLLPGLPGGDRAGHLGKYGATPRCLQPAACDRLARPRAEGDHRPERAAKPRLSPPPSSSTSEPASHRPTPARAPPSLGWRPRCPCAVTPAHPLAKGVLPSPGVAPRRKPPPAAPPLLCPAPSSTAQPLYPTAGTPAEPLSLALSRPARPG